MKDSQVAELLKKQDHILILTHRRPDGDTIGCAAALCAALRRLGKTAYVAHNEEAHSLFIPYLEGYLALRDFVPRFVVTVDIAGTGLLTESTSHFIGKVDLSIDHHPSNEGFAVYNCVDASCASCGELVYRIVKKLTPVDAEIALPLYLAVSTDTGCFVYSNTTPETHRIAAKLMETGIDFAAVNKRHFRTKSLKRLKMESLIVDRLEIYDGGELAVAAISLDMTEKLGVTERDMEDISAFAGQIEGVKTSVTIRQLYPGECKISLRTSGGLNASHICALLGGGGHAAAAGCTVFGTLQESRDAVLAAVRTVQHG